MVLIISLGLSFYAGFNFGKHLNTANNPIKEVILNTKFPTESTEEAYVERDSPLDNRLSEDGQIIFHGPRDKNKIALTFDAEMTNGMKQAVATGKVKSSYDPRIIEILDKTKTKATLFLTDQWIELYSDITRQLAQNPLFEFGSHSYNDSSFHGYCYGLKQLPNTLQIEQIGSTEKLLREYVGIDNRLFRFP